MQFRSNNLKIEHTNAQVKSQTFIHKNGKTVETIDGKKYLFGEDHRIEKVE